ncbi:putative oxidoreductase CzcO [compost metagenome]
MTDAEGLYFLGLAWLYRRSSAQLGGVGRDAEYLARRIEELTLERAEKASKRKS